MDYSPLPPLANLIRDLKLIRHPEGGYYAETDRQEVEIPSPYADGQLRSLATSIYYLLTPDEPNGYIHMNKSVTMHVHHHGRAEYTLITPSPAGPPRITRAVIGPNVAAGEQRQLLVGTGVWKMSRLLPEDVADPDATQRAGCLITEVVVPGFHWEDHKYLTQAGLDELFAGVEGGEERVEELRKYVKVA
ncbi:hypothetical protein FA95DRAFT_1504106 [Auriscalpium vulgare]|uniref:Uncharacterized protein n=1 Tax=Auriscalpium vulgare TaxID=40419 RepID=A0ACB8R789_9AGAM|nr:hypothetical protein FA95DRAFT_1504106 [Auriscalpium vulgare]